LALDLLEERFELAFGLDVQGLEDGGAEPTLSGSTCRGALSLK
jgi:hypothetical protein